MRTFAVVLCVVTAIPTLWAAEPLVDQPLTLTLRIHDYHGLAPGALATAERLVSDVYRSIGIQVVWYPTLGLSDDGRASPASEVTEDLSINVLGARSAARRSWQKNALGSAAVGQEGRGHIAYILYDRIAIAAMNADWGTPDLLALVLAHEIGHLLLPRGSHSPGGVMRGHWDLSDLRGLALASLTFTPGQAGLIRTTLTDRRAYVLTRGN